MIWPPLRPKFRPSRAKRSAGRKSDVGASACSVDLKEVSSSPVSVGVQDDAHRVIALHITIAPHGMNGNPAGIRILAFKAKIDAVLRDHDSNFGFKRSRLSWFGRLLDKL